MEKILSIIIPSYNSKPFLAKCLDSLLCECTDKLFTSPFEMFIV